MNSELRFDLYEPTFLPDGRAIPGIKPQPKTLQELINYMQRPGLKAICDEIAQCEDKEQKAELKKKLPLVGWVGRCKSGKTRAAANMEPTQFYMIDVDHVKDVKAMWEEIKPEITREYYRLLIAHITPSGGLRLVLRCRENFPTLAEHMHWLNDKFEFNKWGDFDTAVKDLSRGSFLPYIDKHLFSRPNEDFWKDYRESPIGSVASDSGVESEEKSAEEEMKGFKPYTDEERKTFDNYEYRGTPLKLVIEKYIEVYGEPGSGEIHNFYNEMVKNFRCICDNNKRLLLYVLPKFGHKESECWSQIVSICRVNTLSRLPKSFYFFLKDNGFYNTKEEGGSLREYMMSDQEAAKAPRPPYAPPIFREILKTTPDDFVLPVMNSLLPIMGTLTSYLRAIYPYDGREHSTSFFSVIYAPPGTGKGFVERFLDLFFEDLRLRDFVESERENIYLRILNRKGANDKSPDIPHVSLRLIPPKNSEAEFLQKQRDNHGYHMFTYAAEMDSWAKGVRAAGGNKDDMIRIAWDNGEYGQQFKSANTFKGTVRLYWNVLITGTIAQVENYFKNVENGLVTRCSFTSIENQEFTMPAVWKKLNKADRKIIKEFTERCDLNTYEEPLNVDVELLSTINDDDFDKEVDWKFRFREKQMVDMEWIMPTIERFENEQMKKAALDIDRARDVFRRRVGVRGFRLGMMCMACYKKPRPTDLEKCCDFVYWWMTQDLECMMKLWAAKYNEQTDTVTLTVQRTVFDGLGDDFTREDIYVICAKQGIKTPVRRILHEWKKLGYIVNVDKNRFKKVKK